MKSKSALPWLLAAAALAALVFFAVAGQKKNDEMARLTAETAGLEALHSESESLRNLHVSDAELDRLRAENQELYKLRNAVWKLRRERGEVQQAQLGEQVSGQIYGGEPAQARVSSETPFEQLGEAPEEGFPETPGDVCIRNLTKVGEAKLQWALANRRRPGASVTFEQIVPFLENGVIPTCPEGGTYTINKIDFDPSCSVADHKLVYEAFPNR
jgi:hypothetical protein